MQSCRIWWGSLVRWEIYLWYSHQKLLLINHFFALFLCTKATEVKDISTATARWILGSIWSWTRYAFRKCCLICCIDGKWWNLLYFTVSLERLELCPKVQTLIVRGNRIEAVPDLRCYSQLWKIDLANNVVNVFCLRVSLRQTSPSFMTSLHENIILPESYPFSQGIVAWKVA